MSSAEFWVGPASAPRTYRLVALVGGGGEGEVWRAEIPLSTGGRRQVAVKILPSSGSPDESVRWDRVGHLLSSLSHPGLVRVTDVFTGIGPHRDGEEAAAALHRFVVMDYVEGLTLREWCDENLDASVPVRLRMLRMVASALDEMHSGAATEVPVAHGDVKPSNVVVRPDGGTVLVDLGLTRLTDGDGVSGYSAPYNAPEQRVPAALATPEADRYAFAAATAQVLTGQELPTGSDGWLDLAALERQLRLHPNTRRRPALVKRILDVLTAPPEARPRRLRQWLDAAVDAVSSPTTSDDAEPEVAVASPNESDRIHPPRSVSMTAQPPSPAQPAAADPPPPVGPSSRRRRWLLWAAIPVVIALLAAGSVVALEHSGVFATEVQAEPISTAGANAFMPPAGQDQTNVTAPPQLMADQQPGSPPPAVSGDTHGLYGGTLDNSSCDAESMISFLSSHPAESAAWAGVEGISPADLPGYIRNLTPMVLRTDTAVTNHGFYDGSATTLHSVLQAGTAVLVDTLGVPRARCFCGNPLTPPVRFTHESYAGPTWPTFAPQQIVVIQPAPVVINVFVLVDTVTNIVIDRPAGTSGDHDRPDGSNLSSAGIAGTYDITSTTSSCSYGLSCGTGLTSVQIACATSDSCTFSGSGGGLSRPIPIFRSGSTLTVSGQDEAAAHCSGRPVPGTTVSATFSLDTLAVADGRAVATGLHGTYTVTSPADGGCSAGSATFAVTLAATNNPAPPAASPAAPAPASPQQGSALPRQPTAPARAPVTRQPSAPERAPVTRQPTAPKRAPVTRQPTPSGPCVIPSGPNAGLPCLTG